jgi:hypothetical protein
MAGSLPLIAVGWPALTSGAVLRSTFVNIGENADSSHNGRAQKADDDDLQMGAAVRAVDQWFMPTSRLPRFSPALGQKL